MTLGSSQKPNSLIPTLATREHYTTIVNNQGASHGHPKLLGKAVLVLRLGQDLMELMGGDLSCQEGSLLFSSKPQLPPL